ncbi:hypothetical protein EFK50_10080 [Nocardioides marmoriginsengisoli]|uniref:Uncharacterized protein n=1 Tax=Nocardioides marmoriginsengisoli TaxID=661483 RepID=A0A3N0CFA7_9ACTN|nr:hypothetical protein [Nocardioides marmoriginsengisoli]RNL62142.1 hypothetical protein EFK50_10080 [Nocardioides marmoriginsengisoli]
MLRRTTTALLLSAGMLATAVTAHPLSARAGGIPGLPGSDVELVDVVAQVPGLIDALVTNRGDMLRCPDLAGGTIGTGESPGQSGRSGVDEGNPLRAGDASKAPRTLPRQVVFRSSTQTFNRRFQFAIARGTIWYKSNTASTGIREPWAHLKVPPCFEGRVAGISVDDDELIAIDDARWIYGMDGALRTPNHFNWTLRWGRPFWTGPGMKLPTGIQSWTWSVLSKLEDKTWSDDAGNKHKVGDGKVSHIWLLSHRGQRLTYLDPWLPPDQSYELCSPYRGRFRAAAMSASGSTVFLVGRYGDLYTRLYDFDIAGADPLFFDYSYEDQRGAAKPVIQLPSPGWIRQPKIPGRITDRISIHKTGSGSAHRQLRVEGVRRGRVGFWHKDSTAPRWRFTPTGGRLVGDRLRNPARNTSGRGLGASEDRRYVGTTAAGDRITIPSFNAYCTPTPVQVRLRTGESFALRLHTVDNIRQFRQGRGLGTAKRMFNGVLEVPPALRRTEDPQVRAFLDRLGATRFIDANLDATLGTLKFRHQPWTLTHAP